MIKTRFAPSPTGELHIGNARSALFEYLFAKHSGGNFLIRVEDTDRERFVQGATERIVESIKWLGILPENLLDVMIQSTRLGVYKTYAKKLVEENKAYICTCSKEKLETDRNRQIAEKRPPKYAGHCREAGLKFGDIKDGEYVIRMKMPQEGKIVVNDLIRGKVEFDLALADDQVLQKSDGFPTYHLAAIVDDHEMGITHVIRGEEWLSSTPKHVILNQMFGFEVPTYAHLPMILAPDKTKLSKRHGATSVVEYKKLGYLPEALVNFMVLLGWNPGDEREYFTLSQLEKEFTIERVNKAPAVFNIEKLNSINEYYLKFKVKSEKLKVIKLLEDFGLSNVTDGEMELLGRGGFITLKEMADYILELRKNPDYKAEILIYKKSDRETTVKALKLVSSKLVSSKQWNSETIQQLLTEVVSEGGFTNGDVFWPVRVALSGKEKSPSPVELAVALGRDESVKRIEKAIAKLQK